MKVLVDTNVIMDALIGRQPYFDDADTIIKLCADKKVGGYLAAHTIPNLFYILRKYFSEDDRRTALLQLCEIFVIEGIDSQKIITAIGNKNFTDFEDCLQDECAASAGVDYIITRNIKDFLNAKIEAILPSDFLKIYGL